jgi:imidazole glycerol-phosphate synthase subunit HisH
MIIIADFRVGNVRSVLNMLARLQVPARISSSPEDLHSATKIILPGVGAFDTGMRRLRESGLAEVLRRRVLEEGVPLLGICLGMQLLARGSSEGETPGLGWLDADVVRFEAPPEGGLKIPHMGWNHVEARPGSRLFVDMPPVPRFYFVHSYHFVARHMPDVAAVATHGGPFVAAIEHDNILGVQFHPEKSHRFGMQLLHNFATHY